MFLKAISNISTQNPACHPGISVLTAHFDFPIDISELFPYINATLNDVKWFDRPNHIKFTLQERSWVLYPEKGVAAAFETRQEAVEYLDRLVEFLNDLYEKKDSLTPDNKKYVPIPVIEIYKNLPRTNCKECGFNACMAFAAALSKGEVSYQLCPGLDTLAARNELAHWGLCR